MHTTLEAENRRGAGRSTKAVAATKAWRRTRTLGARTRCRGQDPQPEQDPQRAAELQQGAMDIVQRLQAICRTIRSGLDLLDSLASSDRAADARGDVWLRARHLGGHRPPDAGQRRLRSVACRGLARGMRRIVRWRLTSGRVAPGLAVRSWRMTLRRLKTCCRRGRAGQAARTAASIEKRFPGALGRLKRAF